MITLITEPMSGNILLSGFADGKVKLYDTRHSRNKPLLSWQGDDSHGTKVSVGDSICKVGVVLGEGTTITCAW